MELHLSFLMLSPVSLTVLSSRVGFQKNTSIIFHSLSVASLYCIIQQASAGKTNVRNVFVLLCSLWYSLLKLSADKFSCLVCMQS